MDAINRICNDLVPNPYQNLSQTALNDKLIEAAITGNLREVTLLIENSADIHATNVHGSNALMSACARGWTDTAALLLEKGADIHAKNNKSDNALMFACSHGRTATAAFLLEKGADIHTTNKDGDNALMFACACGWTDTAAFLLEKGADIYATNKDGDNALMSACWFDYTPTATAALLLEIGANIHAKNNEGENALMVACRFGHTDMATFLLEKGADIHAPNNSGDTSLTYACTFGDTETACLLLYYMTPEEREAFASQSNFNRDYVNDFKNNVKEHALVVYKKMRDEYWKIEPNSIFYFFSTELRNYIRSFEAQLYFKEKFKDSWYRFRAFSEMNTVAQYCASSHGDKPIFPVLFLSNKRKAQGEPGEGNNPNKKRLLTEKGNGNKNQFF